MSAQKAGILPISQQSTFVLGSLACHAYEGWRLCLAIAAAQTRARRCRHRCKLRHL